MSAVSKIKWHQWRELNPLWWSLLSWTLTIGGYGTGEMMIRSFGWGGLASKYALFSLVGVVSYQPCLSIGETDGGAISLRII